MHCVLIGSFRKHFSLIQETAEVFRSAGIEVLSPENSRVIDPEEQFVLLESDRPDDDDATIQLIVMLRMLKSTFVYVVCPDGYVGRTTCFELGFLAASNAPVFFSDQPDDLPIAVASSSVLSPRELVRLLGHSEPVSSRGLVASDFHANGERYAYLATSLIAGKILSNNELKGEA